MTASFLHKGKERTGSSQASFPVKQGTAGKNQARNIRLEGAAGKAQHSGFRDMHLVTHFPSCRDQMRNCHTCGSLRASREQLIHEFQTPQRIPALGRARHMPQPS